MCTSLLLSLTLLKCARVPAHNFQNAYNTGDGAYLQVHGAHSGQYDRESQASARMHTGEREEFDVNQDTT